MGDLKPSKELKEKLIGSDREGLGLGYIDRRSEPDRLSEPNTVLLETVLTDSAQQNVEKMWARQGGR